MNLIGRPPQGERQWKEEIKKLQHAGMLKIAHSSGLRKKFESHIGRRIEVSQMSFSNPKPLTPATSEPLNGGQPE